MKRDDVQCSSCGGLCGRGPCKYADYVPQKSNVSNVVYLKIANRVYFCGCGNSTFILHESGAVSCDACNCINTPLAVTFDKDRAREFHKDHGREQK